MGNPTYQRIIICDSTDVATRMVAAAETELQPHYLERLPPSVAEAERGWFDQQVGGLSRSPESIAAALRFEQPKLDPYQWSVDQINDGVNVALYFIDPKGCRGGIVKRYHDGDDVRFGDAALYQSRREGLAVVIFSRPDQHRRCELYQRLVRRFGFISEQLGWVPDFFYTEAGAATDPEIADEHAWVLRGRGEGDRFPQYFKVMTRYLSKNQFEQLYGDGDQMSYKDEVQMHQITSLGLPAGELEALRQAELESAIYRVENDPACQPLHRAILEKAIQEGLLEQLDDEQRARNASARSADSFDGAEDYFAALAQKIKEQSGKGDSHSKPIDEGEGGEPRPDESEQTEPQPVMANPCRETFDARWKQLSAENKAIFDGDDPFRSDYWYTLEQVKEQLDKGLYVGGSFGQLAQPAPIEDRIGTAKVWEKFNRYGVFTREAITDEIRAGSGDLDAVITRASDGFLVLNCEHLMFMDVDFNLEEMYEAIGLAEPLDRLIHRIEDKVVRFAREHDWSIRMYRTHSGIRLMVTHKAWESVDESFDTLCDAVGGDPLYKELCHIQKCFRARLTPKPWRVGVSNPEHSFPFCAPEDEVEFAEWLKKYDEASSHFAVCGLATDVGSGVIAPELAPLIKLHDDYTRATLLSNVTEAVNAGNRWWAKYELEDWDFEPPWPLA